MENVLITSCQNWQESWQLIEQPFVEAKPTAGQTERERPDDVPHGRSFPTAQY